MMTKHLLCAVLTAVTISHASTAAADGFCTVDDCPDGDPALLKYTIDRAQSEYPEAIPFYAECRDHGDGVSSCYAELDLILVTVTIDCVHNENTGVTHCIVNTYES